MLAACMPYREKGPLAVTHRLRWQGSLLSPTAVRCSLLADIINWKTLDLLYSGTFGMLQTAGVPCLGSSI